MKYDLHIHSKYSSCSTLKVEDILKISRKRGMEGIAVTDHNTIKGGVLAKKLNNDTNFEVIVGAEIKTNKGDLLAYYLNEEIKSRQLFEVIDEIKSQGGLAVVAHPFRTIPWVRFHYPLEKLKSKIDGVETFNARMLPGENGRAQKAVKKYGFGMVGGSDAHFKFDLANGYTIFEGDLKKAVKQKKTQVGGTIKYGWLSGSLSFFYKRILSKII